MVDSSVGGKTGVDLPEGKNLAGAFYQPAAVWIDPSVLATLPHRQIANGMAEIIKYGMIADPAFFGRLEKLLNRGLPAAADPVWATLIRISCSIKAGVVEQDEFEQKSVRERLNFGHTFGHALETVTGYRAYLHGEGVALGMVMAGRLAVRQKMFSRAAQERLERLIAAAGLPVKPRQKISSAALLAVMQRDKKNRAGQLRLVLPSRIGSVAVVAAVPRDAVAAVVKNDAR
jgi:3-dehydroquinate synthase